MLLESELIDETCGVGSGTLDFSARKIRVRRLEQVVEGTV